MTASSDELASVTSVVGVFIARVDLRRVRALVLATLPLLALAGCATSQSSDPALPLSEAPDQPQVQLAFADFFKLPVGARGLEATETLQRLRGERVVVRGYMVHEQEPFAGFFMLAPLPVTLSERADGPADLLPPATLYVHLPDDKRGEAVAYVPELVEVIGTLDLGAKEETSGRVSYVRLILDGMASARALGRHAVTQSKSNSQQNNAHPEGAIENE